MLQVSERFLIVFLIVLLICVGIYFVTNKGGYDCLEGTCVFNNSSTKSKKTCSETCDEPQKMKKED